MPEKKYKKKTKQETERKLLKKKKPNKTDGLRRKNRKEGKLKSEIFRTSFNYP